jgi:putative nucleotide binding protein
MMSDDSKGAGEEEEGPLSSTTLVHVLDILDRRPVGQEIQGLTEPSFHLVRSRIMDEEEIGQGSEISIESGKLGTISEIRFKDLSQASQGELTEAIYRSVTSDSDRHLMFYNSAGPMSLKFHSFQLLQGVGNSKALQMVKARGGNGWSTFEQVDESCGIESARLLAERYAKEMEDPSQTPSLLEILVRSQQ